MDSYLPENDSKMTDHPRIFNVSCIMMIIVVYYLIALCDGIKVNELWYTYED